jgi:hypothetical protein
MSTSEQTAAATKRASIETSRSSDTPRVPESAARPLFSPKLLDIGFATALVLALACLALSGLYLFRFLTIANDGIERSVQTAITSGATETVQQLAINARIVMARLALLSCGAFVGMAFGFLGFGLFLLGVKGEMDVKGETGPYQLTVARMTPGVFVILCASILIGICVTRETPFDFSHEQRREPVAAASAPSGRTMGTLSDLSAANTPTGKQGKNPPSDKRSETKPPPKKQSLSIGDLPDSGSDSR